MELYVGDDVHYGLSFASRVDLFDKVVFTVRFENYRALLLC